MLFMIFFITFNLKNKRLSVYLTAITATLSAWFAGLVLDANIRIPVLPNTPAHTGHGALHFEPAHEKQTRLINPNSWEA